MTIERTLEDLKGGLHHIKITKVIPENNNFWFSLKINDKNIMHKRFIKFDDAIIYAKNYINGKIQ